MKERAIILTEGSIHKEKCKIPDSPGEPGLRYNWRLDEKRGQVIVTPVRAGRYYYKKAELRRQLEQAKVELRRLDYYAEIGFLPRLISKGRREELASQISELELKLSEVEQHDDRKVETWYRITIETQDKRPPYKGITLGVYIMPKVFEKAQALQREKPLYLGTHFFPFRLAGKMEGTFWWYCNRFWISIGYSEEEAELLLWEKGRREQRKLERLAKAKSTADRVAEEPRREMIPEEVRLLVWERDGGRCVRCGSTEELEFDHIIPVSKGGSNTEKNVQLLCAKCNQEKGAHIA